MSQDPQGIDETLQAGVDDEGQDPDSSDAAAQPYPPGDSRQFEEAVEQQAEDTGASRRRE